MSQEHDEDHIGADLALTLMLVVLLFLAALLLANLIGALNVFG